MFFSQTQLSVSLVSLETVRDFKMWMNFLKRSLRHTITLYHFSTILDVKIAMLQHLTVKISIFFGKILKYKKIMLKSDREITEIYVLTVLTLDYYWVGSLHCTYSTRGGYWGGGSRTFAPPPDRFRGVRFRGKKCSQFYKLYVYPFFKLFDYLMEL